MAMVATRGCRASGRTSPRDTPRARTPFDIISVDAHHSKQVADVYENVIRAFVQPKPVAITEFGRTAYRGAADHGAGSGFIVEYDGTTPCGSTAVCYGLPHRDDPRTDLDMASCASSKCSTRTATAKPTRHALGTHDRLHHARRLQQLTPISRASIVNSWSSAGVS